MQTAQLMILILIGIIITIGGFAEEEFLRGLLICFGPIVSGLSLWILTGEYTKRRNKK